MDKTNIGLLKPLYCSWIPYQYVGNVNLAEAFVHWRQGPVQNAQEKRSKIAECLWLKSWVWFGVYLLWHTSQVLMGALGNTIPMSKGTDGLLQSCVNCCRCQFMVLYWPWNSFVLCCSGLCCPWDIVCLFFICQRDEQVALRTMVNAKSALGIVALCSVLALHCESSFCGKLPCHKLRRRQYKIN